MDAIRQARTVMHDFVQNTDLISNAVMGGNTPTQVDIQEAMDRDVVYIQVVMVFCLYLILAMLLRSLLAPIYLMATVLLSYFTTMGLCSWIFVDLLGHDGMGFFMPIIVFVLLVALGSDYNIFLMSRIKEEAEIHHIKISVRRAVAMTGGIISACGLILGGTFAALVISPILMLMQIGVAVAIGVFLDTFVIRPLLVPAITSLIGRYTWWPFGHKKVEAKEPNS
jgi:RND superfamily putative drug exporter